MPGFWQATLDEYGAFHQDRRNRAAHWFGLPLILAAVFGLSWRVPLDVATTRVPLGAALLGLFCVGNVFVHARLAVPMAALATAFAAAGVAVDRCASAALWGALAVGVAVPVFTHVVCERRWPDTPARLARFEAVGHLWFLGVALDAAARALPVRLQRPALAAAVAFTWLLAALSLARLPAAPA